MSTIYLDKYLNDVLTKIYSNQNLCKYLYYDNETPLSMIDIVDTTTLLTDRDNRRIYVEPFNPDMMTYEKSFLRICVSDADSGKDIFYKNVMLKFYVVSHKDLSMLSASGGNVALRQNAILHELGETFNKQQTIGIGKDHYSYTKEFQPNEWFGGYVWCISGLDFSQSH